MLADLLDLYKKAIASMQPTGTQKVPAEDRRDARSGRAMATSRADREPMPRRANELRECHSDFQGEAPGALVNAYREAAEADQGDGSYRRSFVI